MYIISKEIVRPLQGTNKFLYLRGFSGVFPSETGEKKFKNLFRTGVQGGDLGHICDKGKRKEHQPRGEADTLFKAKYNQIQPITDSYQLVEGLRGRLSLGCKTQRPKTPAGSLPAVATVRGCFLSRAKGQRVLPRIVRAGREGVPSPKTLISLLALADR